MSPAPDPRPQKEGDSVAGFCVYTPRHFIYFLLKNPIYRGFLNEILLYFYLHIWYNRKRKLTGTLNPLETTMRNLTIAIVFMIMSIITTGCTAVWKIGPISGSSYPTPPPGHDVGIIICNSCHSRHCHCDRRYDYRWQCENCNGNFGRTAQQYYDGGRRVCRWCHLDRWPYRAWRCTVCNGQYWQDQAVLNHHRGHNTCPDCFARDSARCHRGCDLPCGGHYHGL